jgi:glyoxylase-like metal-dependent hydrolase (beta-lactamase superfamily II)
MNLEDHAGDVIRKGAMAAGVSEEVAAQAAGVSVAELKAYEESAQLSRPINFQALGGAIKLDGAKLERIAKGWLPAKPDMNQWRELRQITTSGSGMTVNCYLAWDEVSRDAALFDTGWEAAPILDLIAQNKLELRHIFLTHLHEDHVAALAEIRQKFPKAHLHSSAKSAPPQQRNRANDFIHLGSLRISNRDTPGHAEEGTTYIIGNWPEDGPHVAIVGDAIFAASIGRGNQSWDLAKQKVREQILSLPPTTLICPGHGPLTTVGEEKANNPFF